MTDVVILRSFNKYPEKDIELANCYTNAIKLADSMKLNSLAFPSLGTGGHAYPIELAQPIALQSTLNALLDAQYLQSVTFVCFNQYDYNYYQNHMKII